MITVTKRKSIPSLFDLSDKKFYDTFVDISVLNDTNTKISLKVDGFGFRFGKTNGVFFTESSRSGIITEHGSYTKYALENSLGLESVKRANAYDDFHLLLSEQTFIKELSDNCKIICEVLLNSLGVMCDEHIIFVKTPYDKSKLGKIATIIPLDTIDFDIEKCYSWSNDDIKLLDNTINPNIDSISFHVLLDGIEYIDRSVLVSQKKIDKVLKMQYKDGLFNIKKTLYLYLQTRYYFDANILGDGCEGLVFDVSGTRFKIKY
jgi:hypothetical protein